MTIALIIYLIGVIAVPVSMMINTALINKCYKDSKFKLPLWSRDNTNLLLATGWVSWITVWAIWSTYKEDIKWHKTTGEIFSKMEKL